MSGHLIHQIVSVQIAAPTDAPSVKSRSEDHFTPASIKYQMSFAGEHGFYECVTLLASAAEDYDNVTFFKGYDQIPAWVPEPPEQYKRLLTTLKEVAGA